MREKKMARVLIEESVVFLVDVLFPFFTYFPFPPSPFRTHVAPLVTFQPYRPHFCCKQPDIALLTRISKSFRWSLHFGMDLRLKEIQLALYPYET